jgi:hypothetical protein
MRDYLKLFEIKEVLDRCYLSENDIELIMANMEEEAETCLCSAFDESECTCGAWDG